MKKTILAACALTLLAIAAGLVTSRSASAADVTAPSCSAVGSVGGPPAQATFTVSDDSGVALLIVTQSQNADTVVPPFTVGSPGPIQVVSTKIDQSQSSTVAMLITDTSGNQTFCQVVFGPNASPFVLTVDSQPPTCAVTASAGPPAQAVFTIQDLGTGLASIVLTTSDNADTPVPPFTVGTTATVTVTATKIDQSQSSTVTIVATDVGGLVRTCTATFLPLAIAARVRGVSATATSRGVRVHWRTASEVGVVGFNVYRSVAGRRSRVNAHLLAARAGSGGGAYSYLVRDGERTARYWVQMVAADGTRTWFGPARVGRSSASAA